MQRLQAVAELIQTGHLAKMGAARAVAARIARKAICVTIDLVCDVALGSTGVPGYASRTTRIPGTAAVPVPSLSTTLLPNLPGGTICNQAAPRATTCTGMVGTYRQQEIHGHGTSGSKRFKRFVPNW